MTAWSPVWRIKVDGVTATNVTLSNIMIRSGRSDIYSQPTAGSCSLQLINTDSTIYPFTIGTSVSIEIKNSAGTFIPLFGGYITDYGVEVHSAGSLDYTTIISITALGALSKLPKIIHNEALAEAKDGDQIYTLLSGYLLGQWSEVPAATTWATYEPATGTWATAANIGLGDIDTGQTYDMISRAANPDSLYNIVAQIAQSGFGYIYEDAQGNIGYASTLHRQNYLTANGYVTLDAHDALANGIGIITKSGDVRNKLVLTYDSNGNKSYTYEDTQSQSLYGIQAQSAVSSIKNTADAEALTQRYISLRAFPHSQLQSMTFPIHSPEIDDTDRDALLGIFMGMPVDIQNLPVEISGDSYQGFVEGWTFSAGFNKLNVTINASPVSYSLTANKWENVIASEHWNTLSGTMDWLNATVVA